MEKEDRKGRGGIGEKGTTADERDKGTDDGETASSGFAMWKSSATTEAGGDFWK